MRLSLLLLIALPATSTAFSVLYRRVASLPQSSQQCCRTAPTCSMAATVELDPEPDGGEELTPTVSIANCRMKQMGEAASNIKPTEDGSPAYKFWMTAEAESKLIKEIRTQVLKDASKKANFPGFRKGQVPPYAQPQITGFAVQESIIKTVEGAVAAFGLKALPGSDGEVNVNEDVKALSSGYKTGDSIQFTATLNCAYDPETKKVASDVIDALATEVDDEASTTETETA